MHELVVVTYLSRYLRGVQKKREELTMSSILGCTYHTVLCGDTYCWPSVRWLSLSLSLHMIRRFSATYSIHTYSAVKSRRTLHRGSRILLGVHASVTGYQKQIGAIGWAKNGWLLSRFRGCWTLDLSHKYRDETGKGKS